MKQYWISFRSLTYAQRASRALERKGLTASVARLPQGVSRQGCGYAVILRGSSREPIRILEELRIPWSKLFERLESGEFREVAP